MQDLPGKVAAGGGQRLDTDLAVNHTGPAFTPVEEHAVTGTIASDGPRFGAAGIDRRQKQRPLCAVSSDSQSAYDFDGRRFGRHAPTLAAGTGVLALVPGVNIQTKR